MGRDATALVLGVMDAVEDELPGVLAVEAIVDGVALPPRLHQSSEPQLREMLRDRGGRLADRLGKFADGHLVVEEAPEQ